MQTASFPWTIHMYMYCKCRSLHWRSQHIYYHLFRRGRSPRWVSTTSSWKPQATHPAAGVRQDLKWFDKGVRLVKDGDDVRNLVVGDVVLAMVRDWQLTLVGMAVAPEFAGIIGAAGGVGGLVRCLSGCSLWLSVSFLLMLIRDFVCLLNHLYSPTYSKFCTASCSVLSHKQPSPRPPIHIRKIVPKENQRRIRLLLHLRLHLLQHPSLLPCPRRRLPPPPSPRTHIHGRFFRVRKFHNRAASWGVPTLRRYCFTRRHGFALPNPRLVFHFVSYILTYLFFFSNRRSYVSSRSHLSDLGILTSQVLA
jgi:hypothetical protein